MDDNLTELPLNDDNQHVFADFTNPEDDTNIQLEKDNELPIEQENKEKEEKEFKVPKSTKKVFLNNYRWQIQTKRLNRQLKIR